MHRHLKSLARLLLSLGLMGLFLYWAFRGTPTDQLWQAIAHAPLGWVAAMVVTTLCTVVIRAWRWTVLLRPFAPQVRTGDAVLALAICYAANLVIPIPRSGEAARALSLGWSRGAAIGSTLATVVVERIIDVVSLVLIVGLAVALLRGRLEEAYPWIGPGALLALGASLGLLVCLFLTYLYRERALALVQRVVSPLSERLAVRLVALLDTFVGGLAALHDRPAYLGIILSSALLNLGYGLIIYEAILAYDLDVSHELGATASVVVLAVSSIGVMVPTPGGTGSYHLLFSQSLMLFGVPGTTALACATVVHAMANLTYLAIGGPAFLIQRRRARAAAAPPLPEAAP
ncbi:MAG: lysylphosphatidylglycerol synthase transmembrane domain-containing protein [Gemmatimonadota bacterium]